MALGGLLLRGALPRGWAVGGAGRALALGLPGGPVETGGELATHGVRLLQGGGAGGGLLRARALASSAGERLRDSKRRRLAAEARGRARRGGRSGGAARAPEAQGRPPPALVPPGRGPGQPGGEVSRSSLVQALAHRCLVVTREVEWGGVVLGFEQINRYTLRNEFGEVVGYMAEEGEGFASMLARQVLRTHRPFSATVLDTTGRVLFRVRRPFYFISSTISVEDPEGSVEAEVHQRWHPFWRNYDLYMARGLDQGMKQFASISAGFLSWEFELKSEAGGTLALVDRNFSGLGVELFTDAGKYVVHFGEPTAGSGGGRTRTGPQYVPPWAGGIGGSSTGIGGLAKMRTGIETQRDSSWEKDVLRVERPLRLGERAAVLAAAISIDFDYFSRHSRRGSSFPFFLPFFGGGGSDGDAWPDD